MSAPQKQDQTTYTTADTLDLLALGVSTWKVYGISGVKDMHARLSDRHRLAFDLWLVQMGDVLSTCAGRPVDRFLARVLAMALDRPAINDMGFMNLSDQEGGR